MLPSQNLKKLQPIFQCSGLKRKSLARKIEPPLMPKEYIHTDEFLTLGPDQRRSVYFALCEPALAVWHSYAQRRGEMAYVESVIGPRPPAAGTRQAVDQQLPAEALASARQGDDRTNVAQRYLEPIAALQADDPAFPGAVTFAYYAIYNLFRK
jgi:hypothetical protein